MLQGTEVKSLRQGRASLVDGFVDIDGGEAWLHGVHIPEYSQGTWTNHAARRKRKLLLNRIEIDKIERRVTRRASRSCRCRCTSSTGGPRSRSASARARRRGTSATPSPSAPPEREVEQAVGRRLKGMSD